MAFSRPSIATLLARIQGDIASRTEGSPYIQNSMERVLAHVQAGQAHGLHGHFDWLQEQLLPTNCELSQLLKWSTLLSIPRKGATYASGAATFTGTNTTVLPEGTSLQGPDGTLFETTEEGTVSGGSVTVDVQSVEAGLDANLDAGASISLVTPIAGIDTQGVVATDISGGLDIEDVEDYRARVLNGFRNAPKGGGPGDYVTWALSQDGVTRAWERANRLGYGTVSVGFVRDNDISIIPSAGEVEDVQEYIDSVRPLDMRAVYVVAPIAKPVTMTINLSPDTAAIRTAVSAQLETLFKTTELEEALPLSKISEAISLAAGEDSHTIDAISSLVPSTWELLTLSTITWA